MLREANTAVPNSTIRDRIAKVTWHQNRSLRTDASDELREMIEQAYLHGFDVVISNKNPDLSFHFHPYCPPMRETA
jgi:hypothetical protein